MKTIRRNPGFFGAMALCAAACLAMAVVVAAQTSQATGSKYCEVRFTGCPQDYDGQELVVPLDVIAMSTSIKACGVVDSTVGTGQGGSGVVTPAIMFLIDHTGSMTSGNGAADPNGNRFRVVRALIDSLNKVVPNAQIGMAFFGPGLLFDTTSIPSVLERDPNLVPFTYVSGSSAVPAAHIGEAVTHNGKTQYFMPLLPLSQPVQPGFARSLNPTAFTMYTDMFYIPTSATTRAGIRRNNTSDNLIAEWTGTNISIAFEAAIQEFSRINAAKGITKENQYIIFLSDGVPSPRVNQCDDNNNNRNNPRCPMQDDYMEYLAKLVPTTYTVYLDPAANPTIPPTMQTMTNNIKASDYSETNSNSNIWAIGSDYTQLLGLMMDNILTPILSKSESQGSAKSITVSSAGVKDSSGSITGGDFTFSRLLPVDTMDITPVTMRVRYDVAVDSTWTKADGADTTARVRMVKDSLFEYSFTIQRTANPSITLAAQGLDASNCGDKPRLDLKFGGVNGTSVVGDTVKGNMDKLTVVFDNRGGLFDYTTVVVQIMNTDGTFRDLDTLTLTRTSGNKDIWEYTFPRTVSDRANPGDKALQHTSQDSIVVVFRNPQFPIDTLRVAVPFVSHTMGFYETRGAAVTDTIPSAITIKAGDVQDIYAKLINSGGVFDNNMDRSKITWTIDDPSGVTFTSGADSAKFMGTTANKTYTVTATYKDGPLVVSRTLKITVEPGPAEYLEIVFDTTKIVAKADTNALKDNKEFKFEKGVDKTTFYVVERDKYGNLIGPAVNSNWTGTDGVISATPGADGSNALVTRLGNDFSKDLYVIVRKGNMADTVKITVIGDAAVAIGPNPFVPNRDSPMEYLDRFGTKIDRENYDVIADPTKSGLVSSSSTGKGVLIAATAPMTIKKNDGTSGGKAPGYAMASVMIYDAVGNVVWRSKPNNIILAGDQVTFGFVWDGKNAKGRTVAPGTYLVRMVGTQSDGNKFSNQRKIGVTK